MPTLALIIWIVCGSLAVVFDKKALASMSWPAVGLVYDVLVVVALPAYWFAYRDRLRAVEFNTNGVGWAVAAGIAGHICFFSHFVALKGYEASRVEAYGLLEIALVAVLCAMLLNETITAPKVIGIGLMMVGAYALSQ